MARKNLWGVLDHSGQWIVWHVSETEARKCFAANPDAAQLCSDIDTDEDAGCESHTVVDRRSPVEE